MAAKYKFEMYREVGNLKNMTERTAGDWRWRLKSVSNGKTLADGGEGYKNKADCEAAIKIIKDLPADTPIEIDEGKQYGLMRS